jgi:hypothetical protein
MERKEAHVMLMQADGVICCNVERGSSTLMPVACKLHVPEQ